MSHASRKLFRKFVLALMLCFPGTALLAQAITVVSWGGSYARASQEGYHKPFTEETGIEIRLEDYNGGLAQIRAQVDAGAVYWDVVDLNLDDAIRGCDEGLFELIDPSDLAPGVDGSTPQEDYYPDMLSECGIGLLFYSTVYAYNSERIGGAAPQTIDDFFDLERFPGRRGMRRSPAVNLEFALLADGEVLMTTAYNGRIFNAQVLENQPFVIVWDGQVLDFGQLAVLAGTPRLDAAMRFIEFASRPSSMARVGGYIAYSPARKSAEALVTTHFGTGMEMRPHMPNTPEHTGRAVHSDWRWWSDNGDEMNERFIVWLSR